tara:strand:- start:166 stop:2175 length:2010 start_codon:yes stop_codon:yes gene_type:complete
MAETNNAGMINALKESQKEGARVIKEELKDQFKPFTDQLLAPLTQMKAGIESLPGVGVTKKLFSAVSTPIKNAFAADTKKNIEDQKEENQKERRDTLLENLFTDIRDGIYAISENLLEGLKNVGKGGLYGLGLLAGLIAAPFALLTSFFTQLAKELAVLKKAGQFIFVKPIKAIADFFTNLGTKFKNSKVVGYFDDIVKSVKTFFTNVGTNVKNSKVVGYFDDVVKGVKGFFTTIGTNISNSKVATYFDDVVLKTKGYFTRVGDAIKAIKVGGLERLNNIGTSLANTGKAIKDFFAPVTKLITGSAGAGPQGAGATKGIVGFIKGIFNPIKKAIGYVKSTAAIVDPFMAGVQPVVNFAKGVGTFLGKIFLPLTILMGAYDAITGFMKGYADEEGNIGDKIFSGIKEGLAKVIENLIGLPLDLLKSGLTWLIKTFFGESEVTKTLESFSFKETIGDLVRLPFDLIKGAYNWIKTLFTDPAEALEQLWTGLVGDGGLIDLLFTPIDKALKWVMGVFGFSVPLDENGKEYSIMGIIKDALTGFVNFFKELFSIDVKSVLKSIPGGGLLLKLFEDDTIDEKIADAEANLASIQADVDSDGIFETEGNRQKNLRELEEAQRELEELRAQKAQQTIINNIDNSTNNSGNTNQTTLSSTQLVDGAAMDGTQLSPVR